MTASLRRLRRVRTRAIPSYLVVAQSSELDDLKLTLDLLPICAHGRVIVVAEPGETVPLLRLPARMNVTVRTRRDGEAAAEAAAPTVNAWASEMLCADDEAGADGGRAAGVVAWVAGADESFTDELGHLLCDGHGLPVDALRTGAGFVAH